MSVTRERSIEIQEYILENVESHPAGLAVLVSDKFGVSRQAANRHLQRLTQEGLLDAEGDKRNKKYKLRPIVCETLSFELTPDLEEHRVWSKSVRPIVKSHINKECGDLLVYGFSEIFNNAIDHSGGTEIIVNINIYANKLSMAITDNGIGIFEKIQTFFNLDDPRQALLELVKGKLTSDPKRHTGEGIFFTSRMFDVFVISSGDLNYIRSGDDEWLIQDREVSMNGTMVFMEVSRETRRSAKEVFERYASDADDFGFTRTHVPVSLAQYEGENLVSRSQAKRLLARVDGFKEVLLDFKGVQEIGPAFADEMFRVFANAYPEVKLVCVNAEPGVERMVSRAIANKNHD